MIEQMFQSQKLSSWLIGGKTFSFTHTGFRINDKTIRVPITTFNKKLTINLIYQFCGGIKLRKHHGVYVNHSFTTLTNPIFLKIGGVQKPTYLYPKVE
jgi:hypothetical protein